MNDKIYDVPAGIPVNSTDVDEWVSAYLKATRGQEMSVDDLRSWFSCLIGAGEERMRAQMTEDPEHIIPTANTEPEANPPGRREILDTASRLISGDRQISYGDADESFFHVAVIWSHLIDANIEPWQVPLLLSALKMVRTIYSPRRGDHYVDIAGYAALAAEVAGARGV